MFPKVRVVISQKLDPWLDLCIDFAARVMKF